MARQTHFTNSNVGLSGSIRALASEAIPPGAVVCVTGNHGARFVVSLADCGSKKKSHGLLFVSRRGAGSGALGEFVAYCTFPLVDEGKSGDTLSLTKKGRWGTKKTKTSIPVGRIIEGKDGALEALIAPQGRY